MLEYLTGGKIRSQAALSSIDSTSADVSIVSILDESIHRLGGLGSHNGILTYFLLLLVNTTINLHHPNMSQSEGSSITSSPTPNPSILTPYAHPPPLPYLRAEVRVINGVIWLQQGHLPNRRRKTASSRAWDHGDEYINQAKPENPSVYICDHCNSVLIIQHASSSTTNLLRHQKDEHRLDLKRGAGEVTPIAEYDNRFAPGQIVLYSPSRPSPARRQALSSSQRRLSPIPPRSHLQMIKRFDPDEYRIKLIRFVVETQQSFSITEQESFKDLYISLQPAVERY